MNTALHTKYCMSVNASLFVTVESYKFLQLLHSKLKNTVFHSIIAAKGPIFLGKSCIFSFEYSGQPVSRLLAACERKKYIRYKHRTIDEKFFKACVRYFLSNFFSPNDSP